MNFATLAIASEVPGIELWRLLVAGVPMAAVDEAVSAGWVVVAVDTERGTERVYATAVGHLELALAA